MREVDLIVVLLVIGRIGGLVMTAPLLGHVLVPMRVRAAITLGLAVALTPLVTPPAEAFATVTAFVAAMAIEVTLGAVLGAVSQFVFAGAQLGGQLAGVQMGFGFATLIDPQSHAQTTVIAELQQLLVLLVFLALDMHHVLLVALADSFRAAPLGIGVLGQASLSEAVRMAGEVFVLGLRVAAPVLLVLLLANAAMGVVARTVPQLNVFVVGFPVNVGLGLFVMGAALPFTLRLLAERFAALEPALGGFVQGMIHG